MLNTTGLFDIQINGFAGVDFNAADTLNAITLDHALEAMLRCGVTCCLPTLITAPAAVLHARFKALDRAVQESQLGSLMIPGYHLEGPFLNTADGYAGCHPPSAMCPPDAQLVLSLEADLSRPIVLITYAPEFDHDQLFAKTMSAKGKLLSVGHSAVDSVTLALAAQAGLRLSTHLGNGVPQTLPKLDNTIYAQAACDALAAGFIADGLHLPPVALKSLLRAKELKRAILVTDAVSAAAVSDSGLYPFAGFMVERADDGSVRVPGSRYLAGSSLTLDQAVRNMVDWGLVDFKQAVDMASTHPHQLLADVFERHAVQLPPSQVRWDQQRQVIACQVGEIQRTYPAPAIQT